MRLSDRHLSATAVAEETRTKALACNGPMNQGLDGLGEQPVLEATAVYTGLGLEWVAT